MEPNKTYNPFEKFRTPVGTCGKCQDSFSHSVMHCLFGTLNHIRPSRVPLLGHTSQGLAKIPRSMSGPVLVQAHVMPKTSFDAN